MQPPNKIVQKYPGYLHMGTPSFFFIRLGDVFIAWCNLLATGKTNRGLSEPKQVCFNWHLCKIPPMLFCFTSHVWEPLNTVNICFR